MMKKVTVFILCLMMVSVYAQSFKLYEIVDEAVGDEIANDAILTDTCEVYGSQVSGELGVVVENTSDEDKMVVCEREIIHLIDGADTYFCWNACQGSDVFIDSMLMGAGTKTGVYDFSSHYTAPAVRGSSIVRYIFYDRENREDSISVTFEYVAPSDVSVPIYTENGSLSVYPNPTIGQLTIDKGETGFGVSQLIIENVEIYDVFGRKQEIIVNYQLSTINSIDVSHLPAGMYFLKVGEKVVKFVKE